MTYDIELGMESIKKVHFENSLWSQRHNGAELHMDLAVGQNLI